jgi:alpha-galactosidase
VSSSSRLKPRTSRALGSGAVRLVVLFLVGCGREDIELAPAKGEPSGVDDCSAKLPEGLLSARPPMGWNGFNAFGCEPGLDEATLMANVDALVASGMQSAGYRYVNLDACWQAQRSETGERTFDPVLLPSGIHALADDLHERGLGLGVFAPVEECFEEPTGVGYEVVDAASYASWGADYVKYAACNMSEVGESAIRALAQALSETERPIVLSVAAPPFREWMRDTAQLWRTAPNALPSFSSLLSSVDATLPLAAYAGPGGFNDPDMLEIGNDGLTATEQRLQFSVWSILAAPLLAGNDLTAMTEETLAILTNSRVIALNQDPLALQAALVRREGDVDILAKPLAECGARAVVLFNRGDTSAEVSVAWEELWLEGPDAVVEDLWSAAAPATSAGDLTVTVEPHDARALRVMGSEWPLPSGHVYLSDLHVTYATNGYGPLELDTTNGEDAALDGGPIRLRGAAYEKGLGVHAPSLLRYRLGQACSRFVADVGIDDDQGGRGSVQFEVWADGERLFQSGTLTGESPLREVSVDVSGRRELRLFVGIGGDTDGLDHGVWAGARLECDTVSPDTK